MADLSVDEFLRTDYSTAQKVSTSDNDFSEKALERGVNLALLVTKTYNTIEAISHGKSHAKIDDLEKLEKKLKTVTLFLSEIETQLSNPDAQKIDMADKHELVDEMHQLLDHQLLKKTVWTRAEADAIKNSLTRHSQVIMQQVHHSSSEVNRAIEEGTELLQIARKILEMCQQLHTTFTRNQRPG